MTSAIVMHGLTKDYGSGHGLFDLDLEVAEGEVFGFLGPNGAGKTTTIRLLMGVIHASAGTATIFGLDCDRDSVAVKREVGYLPGELPQFGGMRGSEVVAYLGGMRGGIDRARVTETLPSGWSSTSDGASASTRAATSRSWGWCSHSCIVPAC